MSKPYVDEMLHMMAGDEIRGLLQPNLNCEGCPKCFVHFEMTVECKNVDFFDDEGDFEEKKEVVVATFGEYVFDLRNEDDGYDFDIRDCHFCMSTSNEYCPSPIRNVIYYLQRRGWYFIEDDHRMILENSQFLHPLMLICKYAVIDRDGVKTHHTDGSQFY